MVRLKINEYYEDGKLNTVTAPNEINNGAPYTIKCDYWTNHNSSLSSDSGLWAQTLHYDPINVGNEFETVTISDGLGRAIQVKKKSTIYGVDSVIVSGKIIFDAFGRKITEYQPETEVYSGTINRNYSNLSWQNPTTYSYDIMDRPIQQNNPDGTHIIYSYNFGQDYFGKKCFKTSITDPNGNVTEQYKDARNLQTTVVAPMNTITKFIYTPLGQIKTSIDPEGNATHYNYDMLGRLIEREHPDAGITQYQYDLAGNILKKISENSDIEYKYGEGRLSHIHYPGNDEMDVYYEYGAAGSGNESGRLIKQQDASGVQTFWYGNMGELVGNIHTYVVPGGEPYTFEMRWMYDSWNRLINIQYPDGELVSYRYDNGGKLIRMNGEKLGEQYHYIDMIIYDKFDSRTSIHYGNGTYSEYYYDPLNRRLKNLKSYDANGHKMHDIDYKYDGVGNIIYQSNNGEYVNNGAGGPYNYHYEYDDLYRLIQSEGYFASNHNGSMYYNLNMSYSPSGNITNKHLYGQTLINGGVNNIYYNRDYHYNGRPHQVTKAGENEYEWDRNGNMIFRNTLHGKRYQCWDNEDRLVAVHDEGDMPQISAYLYDGGGERVWKLTGGVIQNYMNGQQIYSSGHLDKTLYASPYMVMTEKEYTKHYYIEGERICSKIGSGFQGAHTPPKSTPIDFIAGSAQICSMQLREMVGRNAQCAMYNGEIDIDPYLPPAHNDGNEYEKLQYFYHSDHLGSASFITDIEGAVMQHLQYLPYGELFISQRSIKEFDSRYKFIAKELDNETSYTYFGARYYDSELSVWLSVDPMSDKYPSLSPYCYSADNPVVLVDPNGENFTNFVDEDGNLIKHIDDGSNAVFRQTGSGTGKHYTFIGYDESQGGVNKVNLEVAIQEQQKLNNDNPSLQQNGNTTYCNFATQNVMKTVASTPLGHNALVTGRANEMIDQMLSGNNPNYISVSEKDATEYAAKGGLAIVGYRNPNTQSSGHVATFSVGDNITESNIIANIGIAKSTGFVPLNYAIAKSKAKSFFIFIPGYVLNTVTVKP